MILPSGQLIWWIWLRFLLWNKSSASSIVLGHLGSVCFPSFSFDILPVCALEICRSSSTCCSCCLCFRLCNFLLVLILTDILLVWSYNFLGLIHRFGLFWVWPLVDWRQRRRRSRPPRKFFLLWSYSLGLGLCLWVLAGPWLLPGASSWWWWSLVPVEPPLIWALGWELPWIGSFWKSWSKSRCIVLKMSGSLVGDSSVNVVVGVRNFGIVLVKAFPDDSCGPGDSGK